MFSASDVDRLAHDRGPDARIHIMTKVAAILSEETLSAAARAAALELMHQFARDAVTAVREAVAWQLCNSPHLDGDLALMLARDVASVAAPVLRTAAWLSDADLLAIIAEEDALKQAAIAERSVVSERVAEALVRTRDGAVVAALMGNAGARIAPPLFDETLDWHGADTRVTTAMASRGDLPVRVFLRLLERITEDLGRELAERHGVPLGVVRHVLDRGREMALLRLFQPLTLSEGHLTRLIDALNRGRRLTPRLLFAALCGGDQVFFTEAMAARAGMTVVAMQGLLSGERAMGVKAALRHAAIPANLEPPFAAALAALRRPSEGVVASQRQHDVLASVFARCASSADPQVHDLLTQMFDGADRAAIDEVMARVGLADAPVRGY